jgi:hypothetical protein
VSTVIRFSGAGGDSITVDESPEDVLDVFSCSNGLPLRLTRGGSHDGVYINPERIACWYPSADVDAVPDPVIVRRFRGPI